MICQIIKIIMKQIFTAFFQDTREDVNICICSVSRPLREVKGAVSMSVSFLCNHCGPPVVFLPNRKIHFISPKRN
jgi:hypothetical protein